MLFFISSRVVGPRRPFRMDPDLDYEIDSDEEWVEVLKYLLKCEQF